MMHVQAQNVLNTAGRTISPPGLGFVVDYSLGEVATLTLSNLLVGSVTQGVLQPPPLVPSNINEAFDEIYGFKCFPNPTAYFVTVETAYSDFSRIRIINIEGKVMQEDKFDYSAIDFTSFTAGTYTVCLFSLNKPESKTFKIIKQ